MAGSRAEPGLNLSSPESLVPAEPALSWAHSETFGTALAGAAQLVGVTSQHQRLQMRDNQSSIFLFHTDVSLPLSPFLCL